jgi:hypothetical protein
MILMVMNPSDVTNVLIDSVYTVLPYEDDINFSEQVAIWPLSFNGPTHVNNLTIANCEVPSLIEGHSSAGGTIFSNLLCAGNTYQQFIKSWSEPHLFPPSFRYSCLQEPWPGVGNFVAAPQFETGADLPYVLADGSPGIDAGDPDPACNDVEDPQHPGFAQWPSKGTVRNDVGWLGGPGVGSYDWLDVAPPSWPENPATRPGRASLGAPWPNPFNPVLQVPVTLRRHSLIKVEVRNLLGQQVAVLKNGVLPAGDYAFAWNATGQASGVYIVTLTVNHDVAESRTVTLLR